MSPNKFSRFTQISLGLVGQAVLIVIAVATIFAIFQAARKCVIAMPLISFNTFCASIKPLF